MKREIAEYRIIPFSRFFKKTSKYGRTVRVRVGTPTGALILHGLVSCITIAATPFYPVPTEGISFMINLYTYSHSVIGGKHLYLSSIPTTTHISSLVLLGLGIPKIRQRMIENQTSAADMPGRSYSSQWEFKMMPSVGWRYVLASIIVLINAFLVAGACIPLGAESRIHTWTIPATVLPMYALGALVGIYILATRSRGDAGERGDFYFRGSGGPEREEFWDYDDRKWIIQFPESVDRNTDDIHERQREREFPRLQPWSVFSARLARNGEAEEARALRARFGQGEGTNGAAIQSNVRMETLPSHISGNGHIS